MNMESTVKRVCEHRALPGASSIGEVIAAAGLHPEEVVREVLTAAFPMAPGLVDRLESALDRITSGRAPMRIPAEQSDPDVVLAEVLTMLEGRQPQPWGSIRRPQDTPQAENEVSHG